MGGFKNQLSVIGHFFAIPIIFMLILGAYGDSAKAQSKEDQQAYERQLASVPRIDCRQALALFESGKAILILSHNEDTKTPIIGAHNLPYSKADKVKLNIPNNIMVLLF
jgi:hypothetical protein